MPCRTDGMEEAESTTLRRELDKVTAHLCGLLENMHEDQLSRQPPALKKWWKDHQIADRRRQREEDARRAAEEQREKEHGVSLMSNYLNNKKDGIPGFVCVGIGAKTAILYIDKKSNLPKAMQWLRDNVVFEKLVFVDVAVSGKPVPLGKL